MDGAMHAQTGKLWLQGHRDYMPESRNLEALRENRVLILAKGNDATPFSRAACDALNAVDIHSSRQ